MECFAWQDSRLLQEPSDAIMHTSFVLHGQSMCVGPYISNGTGNIFAAGPHFVPTHPVTRFGKEECEQPFLFGHECDKFKLINANLMHGGKDLEKCDNGCFAQYVAQLATAGAKECELVVITAFGSHGCRCSKAFEGTGSWVLTELHVLDAGLV